MVPEEREGEGRCAAVKKSGGVTSRPMPRRVVSLRQRSWQRSRKALMLASSAAMVGGMGCWALELRKGPKLKALMAREQGAVSMAVDSKFHWPDGDSLLLQVADLLVGWLVRICRSDGWGLTRWLAGSRVSYCMADH